MPAAPVRESATHGGIEQSATIRPLPAAAPTVLEPLTSHRDGATHGPPDPLRRRGPLSFEFGPEGHTLGVRVTETPGTVLAACQTRDLARHFAIPTAEFVAQTPSS
ncbi:hypothetical protein EDD96_5018 [Streptomyces sp. Ag109_G2-6]|nr:hypothetical protein EDD96_5018 [Streptomyces sp. Ag109_G2-6]